MTDRRVLVVGAGISGLAAAYELTHPGDRSHDRLDVEVWEAAERLGGKIATSPFGGIERVDEGADAFLTRLPAACELAIAVGFTAAEITSPATGAAAVWHDGLHDIPDGLVLGVPASIRPFIRTRLLSWRGKLRAAIEPFLPATEADDSIGTLVRARFGDEVHERLVDALVGSIYATDTDRASLAAVPQLAALAGSNRSLLLGARATRRRAATPSQAAPLFAAPRGGMVGLVEATSHAITNAGGRIRTSRPVASIEPDGDGWRVDGERFDAVVVTVPGRAAEPMLRGAAPDAAEVLAGFEAADVIMVRLAVAGDTWPRRLAGRSGYLVPKPDQRTVTAVSFASQKWSHWRPGDGRQLLRVSLGRDGRPVGHLSDDEATSATVEEVSRHLDVDLQPSEVSITRWIGAFPQYRPHHGDRVAAIDAALPGSIAIAGASYHGIGIPACVAGGRRAAERVVATLRNAT